jgi:hypothetical protein
MNILGWIRRLFRWIFEPRLTWFTVGLIVVAVVISAWFQSELAFRLAGLVLQLLGIISVVVNLHDTSKHFGKGIFDPGRRWLGRRPKLSPQGTNAVINATTLVPTAGVMMSVGHAPVVDIGVAERLDEIERHLKNMKMRQDEFEKETKKSLKQQTGALDEEKRVRASDDEDILEKLQTAVLGGTKIAIAGVVWLSVGVVMSTIPQELANFFTYHSFYNVAFYGNKNHFI